jgi:hypothetical protein
MTTTAHTVAPEDIMALLDGELSASEAQAVSAHLDHCAECANIAEQFRQTSETLARWSVPAVPANLENLITEAAGNGDQAPRPTRAVHRNWKPWAIGIGGLAGILSALLIVTVSNRSEPHRSALMVEQTTSPVEQGESKQFDRLDQFAKIFPPPGAGQPLYEQMGKAKQADRYQGTMDANLAQPAPPPPPPAVKAPTTEAKFGGGADTAPTTAPMIARTVTLAIMVKNVIAARPSLDVLLTRHHGYPAQLTVNSQENAPRSLQASLRIPAPELMTALAELRSFGRVENESQSGEEVTQQHADLVARLQNSRETEAQLRGILQQRAGKVSDILEVEQEIERVRGEIESMEAEQKTLDHRVDFATIDLQLTEEYKAQLNPPADSVSTRLHNAFVAGYHNATETLLGILLFFEEYGPTLLIWLAILTLPVFLFWRRYRRMHSKL